MIPIILAVMISVWFGMQGIFRNPKNYSLDKRDNYLYPRITSTIGKEIEYFVQRGFRERHKYSDKSNNELYNLEKQVEGEYATVLSKQCIYERDRQSRSLNVAKRAKNKLQIKYLEEKVLLSCDKFELLFAGDGKYRDLVPPLSSQTASLF